MKSRHRRKLSKRLLIAGLALAIGFDAPAIRAQDLPAEIKTVERVSTSVDRALEYLASKQKPDGSWHNNNAVNALAILAFLGRGHVPGRGPYRDVVSKATKALIASQRADGYLAYDRMYEHGLATLALAELYGMDPDPKVESALRKAIDLIVKSQAPSGGWRYNPLPNDQDLSVTVMQIVALRAASNAEIPIPAQTVEKAIAYVRSCSHPSGGYAYLAGGAPGPHTTAAGILSMQLLGKGDDPTVPKALVFLDRFPPSWGGGAPYFYYFHYYAIQARYQAGGKHWDDWHPKVRETLLSHQNSDGSWDVPADSAENEGTVGPNKIYWTSMACLILEIYTHYLPAYQR